MRALYIKPSYVHYAAINEQTFVVEKVPEEAKVLIIRETCV